MRALRQELAQLRNSNVEEEAEQEAQQEAPPAFAAPVDPWRQSGVEVVSFHMHTGDDCAEPLPCFAPGMAHQVFGDDEVVIGYRGLRVQQHYAAGSLMSYTHVEWDARRPPERCSPPDVWAALREWHPDDDDDASWRAPSLTALEDHVARKQDGWRPPGTLVHQYVDDDGQLFQLFHAKVTDPATQRYHRRMRVFAIWFVDGARYLDDTDPKWDVFMLFACGSGVPRFCGYVTAYPFFSWTGGSNSATTTTVDDIVLAMRKGTYTATTDAGPNPWYQRRFRISQVLFLPPYQRRGHGKRVIAFLYEWAAAHYAPLRDITVEDPSPPFVAMRDALDVQLVLDTPHVQPHDAAAVRALLQTRHHVCDEQADRVALLLQWGCAVSRDPDPTAQGVVRAAVKRRLYKTHAADIPDGDAPDQVEARVTILNALWDEERDLFDSVLRKTGF